MSNTPKFKKGWVYTYDKYGIISKRLIRAINLNPLYYQLTGDPNYKWKENEMFLRKKDCEQAMKNADIGHKSLEQVTIIRLEEECERLYRENKILKKALELACNIFAENDKAYKSKSKWKTSEQYAKRRS